MPANIPQLRSSSFPLTGGLDVTTPQLAIDPGRIVGGTNYECLTRGGYQRVGGYEPFDGRPKPSSATYTVLNADGTFDPSVAIGQTIAGASSGATGVICYVEPAYAYVAVTKKTGTFSNGEDLQVSAVNKGVLLSQISNVSRQLDNTILANAAAQYMADITAVPGSGSILGVAELGNTLYAIRNNAGGTAAQMYKSTGSGWTLVSLGVEVAYTTGNSGVAIADGDTVTGLSSGASGVVKRVANRTGAWTGGSPSSGSLYFASVTGTFTSGEALQVGGVTRANAATGTPQSSVTLLPGGRFEFDKYNFTGSADTLRLYGADGVNPAFEFDGTTFAFIRTGMTEDKPAHIRAHKNHLFLSFRGSLQHSSIGQPLTWSVITGGASELGVGAVITGLVSVVGGQTDAALFVFCRDRSWILYGNAASDWNLVPFSATTGAIEHTLQQVGRNVIFLDDIGLTSSTATQEFGNFANSTFSELIRPYLEGKQNLSVGSTVVALKNQYKIFFSDKSGLTVTFNGAQLVGIVPFLYEHQPTCFLNTEISGVESVFFGADDGFVYQINKGRSFAGSNIVAYIRTAFNNCKSPRLRKKFVRAIVESKSESGTTLSIQPEFSNASLEAPVAESSSVSGFGARWDEMAWDEFYWDETDFSPAIVRIPGVGINCSLIIGSTSNKELTHTLQAVTMEFVPRRMER